MSRDVGPDRLELLHRRGAIGGDVREAGRDGPGRLHRRAFGAGDGGDDGSRDGRRGVPGAGRHRGVDGRVLLVGARHSAP
eukprot:scaffold11910_cov106-Isochrysis_galbana.AAC.2